MKRLFRLCDSFSGLCRSRAITGGTATATARPTRRSTQASRSFDFDTPLLPRPDPVSKDPLDRAFTFDEFHRPIAHVVVEANGRRSVFHSCVPEGQLKVGSYVILRGEGGESFCGPVMAIPKLVGSAIAVQPQRVIRTATAEEVLRLLRDIPALERHAVRRCRAVFKREKSSFSTVRIVSCTYGFDKSTCTFAIDSPIPVDTRTAARQLCKQLDVHIHFRNVNVQLLRERDMQSRAKPVLRQQSNAIQPVSSEDVPVPPPIPQHIVERPSVVFDDDDELDYFATLPSNPRSPHKVMRRASEVQIRRPIPWKAGGRVFSRKDPAEKLSKADGTVSSEQQP